MLANVFSIKCNVDILFFRTKVLLFKIKFGLTLISKSLLIAVLKLFAEY